MLVQDMETCSPGGRDCIEGNFTLTFNSIVNCEGIYADVQWVEEGIYHGSMEKRIENEESTVGKRGVEQDKSKYMRLSSEYNLFKDNLVQHFGFNDVTEPNFGRFFQS